MTDEVLPSQAGHWYFKDGRPCYQVPYADPRKGMRDTNLGDARKLDLVPSVTEILNVAAKLGLEAWKAKQILEASLTLPRITDESLDDYAVRVMEDAKAQSKKAMERGTQLHAEIETFIQLNLPPMHSFHTEFAEHISKLYRTLLQMGIDLNKGKAEHSFASPLGYGGKIDFHNDEPLVIDFKTKDRIDDKKPLAYENHVQQLAAYGYGTFGYPVVTANGSPLLWKNFRAINVFIGVNDKQVRVIEHTWDDIQDGFEQFKLLLSYWHRIKKFGKYSK